METRDWCYLPPLVLEKVYSYLPWLDRYRCSLVCRSWNEGLKSPSLWRVFTLRSYGNLSSRYQYDLASYKLQRAFKIIGRHIHEVRVPSTGDFYLLNRFLCIVAAFLESHMAEFFDEEDEGLSLEPDDYDAQMAMLNFRGFTGIRSFHFTFHCEVDSTRVYGTGGLLFRTIKRVLAGLTNVESLSLDYLLLSEDDAQFLLEDFCPNNCHSLVELSLVNICLQAIPLFELAMFPYLRRLCISPCHVNSDTLLMLVNRSHIEELVFIQDELTLFPSNPWTSPIDDDTWRDAALIAPNLRVHLRLINAATRDLILPSWHCPVSHVIYNTPEQPFDLTGHSAFQLTAYSRHLEVFVHSSPASSLETHRVDEAVRTLVNGCVHLRVLVLRGTLAAGTLLWAAGVGKELEAVVVRKCSITLEILWSRVELGWTEDRYSEVKAFLNKSGLEGVKTQLRVILNQPNWSWVDDEDFYSIADHF